MEYLSSVPESSPGSSSNPRRALRKPLRASYEVAKPIPVLEPAEEPSSGGLSEYWRIFKRHKLAILLLSVLGGMAGLLIGLPQTPVYRVRTSLEILGVNEEFLNMKQSSPITNNENSNDSSELQTQVKLLESESLAKRVFTKLGGVVADEKPAAPALDRWLQRFHLKPAPHVDPLNGKLGEAADSVKIRATPRTRVIELTVESPDPKLAVNYANTMAGEFIEQNLEARWNTTQRTSEWLGRELDDARSKLKHSEDALQTYARESGLIFTDPDTNISSEKLQQIQVELSNATGDRIAKQSRYELAQKSPADALPDVLNDAALQAMAAKVTDLRRQIADLSAIYTPDFSKVKRAQAELETVQAAFARSRDSILTRINNDYHEATRKEALLASAYDTQTKEVTGQGEKTVQYNILKREVDSNRQLYDTMLQQLKQSSVASAIRASNVRIIDPAVLPRRPFKPNLKVDTALGVLAGMFLSIGFFLLRESSDRTVQRPGETQIWTNAPELGSIPNASRERKVLVVEGGAPGKGLLDDLAAEGFRFGAPDRGKKRRVALISKNSAPSVVAEAFRSVLTSILVSEEEGVGPQVLAITSASAGDGKTTVVSNLGIALAELGKRVLLIDADLRRPRIHSLFHLGNERGLGDLLRQRSLSSQSLDGLIHETEVPGLDVLPSGPPTHAAANLLYSSNLGQALAIFRKHYDMVLIDTPPMLQLTDARVIGRCADAVILVARAERTTRDALLAVSQRFSEDRIPVLGTILNDWNPEHSAGGFYGYKGNSYTTPYGKDEKPYFAKSRA
jgi:succinoglycan biosynthesis transport protein ExoP